MRPRNRDWTTRIAISALVAAASLGGCRDPFLYAIRDDKTGELLFVGALMNPN
jgi:serine protease inhibitor